MDKVVLLNPSTCGIYKDGGTRFQIEPATGQRTTRIDNEMAEHVAAYLNGEAVPGLVEAPLSEVYDRQVLVPRYYDDRFVAPFLELCRSHGWAYTSIGELLDSGILTLRGGHGSPSNDKRSGHIPYIKVSDIRSLRVNINPTNLVTEAVARTYWRGTSSGLHAWDLISPSRASSNIGEFALLLPGEEKVVLTKEVFVIRIAGGEDTGWSPFYLFWALCLKAVRNQWRRVTLMQTNREDVGKRYREILLPVPKDRAWAINVSAAFCSYFTTVAEARATFHSALQASSLEFIESAVSTVPSGEESEAAATTDG